MMDDVLALAVPNVDDFAAEVGVTRGTLYLWRNGKRQPSAENKAALANALERRGGELVKLAEQLRREAGE
jgi:transcriptional regulator with XRE-family HTH domain